ncbi:MAG: type III-B CRISPR module RAMP protein Cmr4 [Motiliproteus sp.]
MLANTNVLLGLVAQTPIHAGSGESDTIIDLPIQREAHTDWPCVYGSGVKGALRARAELQLGKDNISIAQVFGPDTDKAHEHAGALMVSDARLLLLPVRSLTSHYRLVTCPAIINRLLRDIRRLGLPFDNDFTVPVPHSAQALVSDKNRNTADLYLEEYRFEKHLQPLSALCNLLAKVAGEDCLDELEQLLTLVDDDSFRHLCRAATPVRTHIAIDSNTKTVKPGALWNQENLPPETVLYTSLTATRSRDSAGLDSANVMACVVDELFSNHSYLQLGGNETVGMGWCHVVPWGLSA